MTPADTDNALLALRGVCRETIGEIDYLRDRGDSAADAATLARIERQNDRAEHTDREAERDVDACFDRGESWRWDDATGTCVRAVP